MLLEITTRPGTRDFPELAKDLPVVGEIREFPDGIAERLLARNVAIKSGPSKGEAASTGRRGRVRAVPQEPTIAEASESSPGTAEDAKE